MKLFIITKLTLHEAHRRKLLYIALVLGLIFITLFAIGFQYIYNEISNQKNIPSTAQYSLFCNFFLTAGLYVINFLSIMLAVLTSVGAISGEISSHTIQSLATKPIKRWEIIIGKWLAYVIMLSVYIGILCAGLMLVVKLLSGYTPLNWGGTIGLLVLDGLVILTMSILGGTFLSTITNGVTAFMLYAIAFIGGWVEQIGSLMGSDSAVNIGIVISLILPSESLWRRASYLMQPSVIRNLPSNPFGTASIPSPAMVWYAGIYIAVLLCVALWVFARRDL
jgi:ABC-type transport system involved in multi-copper enzyme maturation permease subunit